MGLVISKMYLVFFIQHSDFVLFTLVLKLTDYLPSLWQDRSRERLLSLSSVAFTLCIASSKTNRNLSSTCLAYISSFNWRRPPNKPCRPPETTAVCYALSTSSRSEIVLASSLLSMLRTPSGKELCALLRYPGFQHSFVRDCSQTHNNPIHVCSEGIQKSACVLERNESHDEARHSLFFTREVWAQNTLLQNAPQDARRHVEFKWKLSWRRKVVDGIGQTETNCLESSRSKSMKSPPWKDHILTWCSGQALMSDNTQGVCGKI